MFRWEQNGLTLPVNFNAVSGCLTNSVALSPQANYTDGSTATCRRSLVPTFADRRLSRGQRGGSHTVVNLSFLHRTEGSHTKYNCKTNIRVATLHKSCHWPQGSRLRQTASPKTSRVASEMLRPLMLYDEHSRRCVETAPLTSGILRRDGQALEKVKLFKSSMEPTSHFRPGVWERLVCTEPLHILRMLNILWGCQQGVENIRTRARGVASRWRRLDR
jgi:hypothetical protein